MDETLGQYLKRKRESHFFSVQDVSRSTGMDVSVIAALEENNFDIISPQEMLFKYLNKYSTFLQLNKKDVLRRYNGQARLADEEKQIFPQLSLFSEENPSFIPTKKKRYLPEKRVIEAIAWAVIVVVLSGSIFFLASRLFFIKTQPPGKQTPVKTVEGGKEVGMKVSATGGLSQNTETHVKESPRMADTTKRDKHSVDTASSSMKKVSVIGNSDSKRYHLPGMKYYDKIKSYHKVVFNSEAEAIKAGYSKARE